MQVNLLLAWLEREDILNEIQNRFSEVAPLILDYNYTVSEKQKLAAAQSIHQFYLQGKKISTDTTCNFIQVRRKQSAIRGTEMLFEVYIVKINQNEVFWIMVPCSLMFWANMQPPFWINPQYGGKFVQSVVMCL